MLKYSKLITGIVFLFFTSSAFSQLTLQQQDSIAKSLVPIQDKAVVFVIRPTAYAFAIRMDVKCDSVYIGTTGPKSYIYTVLSPGTYTFLSRSENKSFLEVSLEAGKIYYLEQQVKMGGDLCANKIKVS